MMQSEQYDITYKIVRQRILENQLVNDKDIWLQALDDAYALRQQFPLELAIMFGDPFAPPAEPSNPITKD